MSRKGRERREGVQAWKQWEHEQLPLKRFKVDTYHQLTNTYVVEARTEQEAKELVYGMQCRDELPEPIATREKHHNVLWASEVEEQPA